MKYRIQKSLVLISSLLFLTVASAFAQKSIELKYNLNVGNKFNFVSNIDMDMTFDAAGTTMTMQSVMGIEMTSVVNKVDNNEIYQDFTFDKISMNQQVFGMEIKYDSDDTSTYSSGAGAKIGEEMNKIIGKSISLEMDNYGNIKDLDVSRVTNTDITSNFTSGSTFAVYPQHKVKVNDSWETDIKPLKDGEMKVHVKYTLLKISRKTAIIGIEGTITANKVENQEINLNGTSEGRMTVDRKTGMLINSSIDLDMTMDINQGDTKIPATISSTSTTNVAKVE